MIKMSPSETDSVISTLHSPIEGKGKRGVSYHKAGGYNAANEQTIRSTRTITEGTQLTFYQIHTYNEICIIILVYSCVTQSSFQVSVDRHNQPKMPDTSVAISG